MVTLPAISAGKADKKKEKKKGKSSFIARVGLAIPVTVGNIITSGLGKITGKKYEKQTTTELSKTGFGKALGTTIFATGAAAAIAANPAAAATAAKTVGKQAASFAIKKPALALVGAGVVSSGAAPAIAGSLFKAGKVGGEVVTGKKKLSAETIMDVGKGLGIVAGVGALGTAAGFAGKKILEGKDDVEIPEGTPAIEPLGVAPVAGSSAATVPVTPETEEITSGVKKRRSRTRLQPRREQISQRVDVRVMAGNKLNKFIKNAVYA